MISRRLVQSDSHRGIGIRSASIRPISISRKVGHQKVSNCLGDMKASGAQWIGMKTTGLPVARGGIDGLPEQEHLGLVEHGQQLVLVAVEILHHVGCAAEVVGDEVVGRHRGGAVAHRETQGGHLLGEVQVMAGEAFDFLGGLDDPFQGLAHCGLGEGADAIDQAEVVQAGR